MFNDSFSPIEFKHVGEFIIKCGKTLICDSSEFSWTPDMKKLELDKAPPFENVKNGIWKVSYIKGKKHWEYEFRNNDDMLGSGLVYYNDINHI